MKLNRNLMVAALSVGVLGGGILLARPLQPRSNSEPEPETVSLIRLIATPAAFDGRRVRVVGVAQIEFEQNLIYVTRDDFNNKILTNAIDLAFGNHALQPHERAYSGQYVGVEGVFRARQEGVRGFRSGSIGELTRLERWEADAIRGR